VERLVKGDVSHETGGKPVQNEGDGASVKRGRRALLENTISKAMASHFGR